jgi:pilus assembly protein CpaB
MGRRTLLLITSILVAAIGTALIGLYVRGADNRARQDVAPVKVLVALHDISAGTAPTTRDFRVLERRLSDLPEDPLGRADEIKGRAASTILRGQVLQKQMFTTADTTAGSDISAKNLGVSFNLEDPNRVAPMLAPGSMVRVYATHKDGDTASIREVFGSTPIKVIGIGARLPSSKPESTSGTQELAQQDEELPKTIITLDLTPDQARELIRTDVVDDLYFGLLPPSAAAAEAAGD